MSFEETLNGNEDRRRKVFNDKMSCVATLNGNEDRRRETVGFCSSWACNSDSSFGGLVESGRVSAFYRHTGVKSSDRFGAVIKDLRHLPMRKSSRGLERKLRVAGSNPVGPMILFL